MNQYAKPLDDLIDQFSKLPGIGRKSAEKFALYILQSPKENALIFAEAIKKVKESIRFCSICNNFSADKVCHVCSDQGRNQKMICVVEDPKDVGKIEKLGTYKGVYHVLLGKISPLDGVGPEALSINKLINRSIKQKPDEIILAVGSSTEAEATALFLTKALRGLRVKLTRIAFGIPVGSSLEYTDSATLIRSIEGRQKIER